MTQNQCWLAGSLLEGTDMGSHRATTASALALVLAFVNSARAGGEKSDAHIFNITQPTRAMSVCPANMAIVSVIRAIIPSPFNPASFSRNVFIREPLATANDTEANHDEDNPLPGKPWPMVPDYPNNGTTLLSMDISGIPQYTQPAPNQAPYVEVRIILKDTTQFDFYNQDGIVGVGYADASNALEFCGARIDPLTGPSKFSVVVFFVPVGQTGVLAGEQTATAANSIKPVQVQGSFNVGLTPKSYPYSPIFIDPIMNNNG